MTRRHQHVELRERSRPLAHGEVVEVDDLESERGEGRQHLVLLTTRRMLGVRPRVRRCAGPTRRRSSAGRAEPRSSSVTHIGSRSDPWQAGEHEVLGSHVRHGDAVDAPVRGDADDVGAAPAGRRSARGGTSARAWGIGRALVHHWPASAGSRGGSGRSSRRRCEASTPACPRPQKAQAGTGARRAGAARAGSCRNTTRALVDEAVPVRDQQRRMGPRTRPPVSSSTPNVRELTSRTRPVYSRGLAGGDAVGGDAVEDLLGRHGALTGRRRRRRLPSWGRRRWGSSRRASGRGSG